MTRARWVHPHTHAISKFRPHDPPERGDVVLVDDERCLVLRCPVKRDGQSWQMGSRGIKVKPDPLPKDGK